MHGIHGQRIEACQLLLDAKAEFQQVSSSDLASSGGKDHKWASAKLGRICGSCSCFACGFFMFVSLSDTMPCYFEAFKAARLQVLILLNLNRGWFFCLHMCFHLHAFLYFILPWL